MQEMQETGQPPKEIMKSIAPDLEFGEDGLPPLPSNPQNPQCLVM
jgi:hypothetical protein